MEDTSQSQRILSYDVVDSSDRANWREYRGLGLNELAEKAKIAGGYLSEIENWKKPGKTWIKC